MNNHQPKILAIIPARGGSKRLPKKNSLLLANRPLLDYSIQAAVNCPLITDTIVSSEDEYICQLAMSSGVMVVKRPESLATDTVSNEYVVEHAINIFTQDNYFPDYIVLLQPTSPLRTSVHLQQCLELFLVSNMKSVMSVCLTQHHPGKYIKITNGEVEPYTKLEDVETRIQELEPIYRQNGAIYALKTTDFLTTLKFYQPPCLPFIMPIDASIDIDCKFDLLFCEFLLSLS